jgi:hypothetical protein
MLSTLLTVLVGCAAPSPAVTPKAFVATTVQASPATIPSTATMPAHLSTQAFKHYEILRIVRDFGQPDFEIALDSWLPRQSRQLAAIRLWWVHTGNQNQRRPLSDAERRRVHVGLSRQKAFSWEVRIAGDHKEFDFQIEVGDDGRPRAYTTVVRADGRRISHCRATHSKLHARRFLGIPIGIRKLTASCIDDEGTIHNGRIPYRRLRR